MYETLYAFHDDNEILTLFMFKVRHSTACKKPRSNRVCALCSAHASKPCKVYSLVDHDVRHLSHGS